VAGEEVHHLTPSKARELGIACIYQQPALFPDLTVAENIGLRLKKAGLFSRVSWTGQRTRATELLHRIGAEISPDAKVQSLSMPE
jgi:rhamnose transport system ATP-binding protein